MGDVILAWTTYRDYLIQKYIDDLTNDFSIRLQERLREAASQTSNPSAQNAIDEIIGQLESMTFSQRDELLRQIETKVRQLESIRGPAKQFISQSLAPIFARIEVQGGTGCQQRMRQILLQGFEGLIGDIRSNIRRLVQGAVDELLQSCSGALHDFGQVACARITYSVDAVAETSRMADETILKQREEVLADAIDALERNKFRSQADYWAWHDTLYPGGSSNSPEWQELARAAKSRDGRKCVTCGSTDDLHADHIVPLAKGGSNDMSNLQTLCLLCHEEKTGRPLRRWRN